MNAWINSSVNRIWSIQRTNRFMNQVRLLLLSRCVSGPARFPLDLHILRNPACNLLQIDPPPLIPKESMHTFQRWIHYTSRDRSISIFYNDVMPRSVRNICTLPPLRPFPWSRARRCCIRPSCFRIFGATLSEISELGTIWSLGALLDPILVAYRIGGGGGALYFAFRQSYIQDFRKLWHGVWGDSKGPATPPQRRRMTK